MVSNDEKLLKNRIQHLLKTKNCPIAWIDSNPTQQARLGRQINGAAAVPFSTLQKILYMFPDVSADWLIMGEGSIYKAEHIAPHIHHNNYNNQLAPGATQTGPVAIGHDTVNVIREREIEERDQLIAQLKQQVAELKRDKELNQNIIEAFIAGRKK